MIEVRNDWKPAELHLDGNALLDQNVPFDMNFCFPIRELETEKVKLVPFVPALHMSIWHARSSSPSLWTWLSSGPYESPAAAAVWHELHIRRDPTAVWFAVIDRTRADPDGLDFGGAYAGNVGLLGASRDNASAEIGYVMILPEFQRTHVTSHAVSVLLQYLLNLPTDSVPGLGLRRVEWRTNVRNERSIAAAERLGFKKEAVRRWQMVLPEGKVGEKIREGDPIRGPGRHSAWFALCWDDWEDGRRQRAEELMSR